MSALVSPLEALAFDYLSFGMFTVVNNLWTWVALVTAAVSFWRIRAAGGGISISVKSETTSSSNFIHCRDNEPKPACEISSPEPATQSEPPTPSSPAPSRPSIFEDDGVIKGKFVMYYEDDGESAGEGELTVVREWDCHGVCGELTESFESVLRMRMGLGGDMGWYRYQDLTAINGNVVRLWDGIIGRRGGKDSSGCGTVW